MSANAHIDWLSFTVRINADIRHDHKRVLDCIPDDAADEIGPELASAILAGDGWKRASGRRPYQAGYHNEKRGLYIWYGGQSTVLFEFTGTGCQWLQDEGILLSLATSALDRLTRLDIAIDWQTSVTPREFVSAGHTGRINAVSHNVSSTGQTSYIGSRKSDRYACVYRYEAPHPRADRLRLEYRLKKDRAQTAAQYIAALGVGHAAGMLHNSFQWEHQLAQTSIGEKMHTKRDDRRHGSTLSWLIKQVAPAVRRLIEQGEIDNPEEFFREHFMPDPAKPKQERLPLDAGGGTE